MHLDEPVLVGVGPIDDEEDVVVVLVELGSLPEVLGVLECERVELEDVAQDLEVVRIGSVEIEPEELARGEQLLDLLAAEVRLRTVLADDHMAGVIGRFSGNVAHVERIRPDREEPCR